MSLNALITGNSSGLGKGLTRALLEENYQVYGCSRSGCRLTGKIKDIQYDLTNLDGISNALDQLLNDVNQLSLVILNAGILGRIKTMQQTSIQELRSLMNINVWSNKCILDYLLGSDIQIDQIILMSSGAAVLGNKGWNGYALSKAGLNMLGRLYAHEFLDSHIVSIAPGLIQSPMMDELCSDADPDQFPALARILQAKKDGKILTPNDAARRILTALPHFKDFESGSFIDIRQILAPDEYAELMKFRNDPSAK